MINSYIYNIQNWIVYFHLKKEKKETNEIFKIFAFVGPNNVRMESTARSQKASWRSDIFACSDIGR